VHKTRWLPLKLALENPWTAAQRFLQANDLPMSYLDEVVKFIEKNSAGVSLGAGGSQYSDPYTGADSFIDVLRVFPDVLTFTKAHHDTSQAAGTCRARVPAVTLSLGRRDTNPLQMPQSRRTLGEAIHPVECLGTNYCLRHPVPIKAVTRTHSRGQIGINLPLHLDSRPRPLALLRPALLHQPRGRVMSSLM